MSHHLQLVKGRYRVRIVDPPALRSIIGKGISAEPRSGPERAVSIRCGRYGLWHPSWKRAKAWRFARPFVQERLTRLTFSERKPPCACGSYPSVVLNAVDPPNADYVEIRRFSFRLSKWPAQNEADRMPSVYSIPRVVDTAGPPLQPLILNPSGSKLGMPSDCAGSYTVIISRSL
jgi:hypothetical protein